MTLRSQITADVATVFHNTDDFAEEIAHHRPPDMSVAETISAVVDYDTLDGLQGQNVNTDSGLKIKQRAILEIASSVEVEEEKPGGEYPSIFEIFERDEDGAKTGPSSLWVCKRIIGKDHAMQSVEVHRTERKVTRRTEPR